MQTLRSASSLEKRKQRGDLTAFYNFLKWVNEEKAPVTDVRIHRKGTKLHQRQFRPDIRKNIVTVREVRHWKRLPY